MATRPRRSHVHRDADLRGDVDQTVYSEDVFALPHPAHLAGQEAQFFGRVEVLERQFGDVADYSLAQLRAQGSAGGARHG